MSTPMEKITHLLRSVTSHRDRKNLNFHYSYLINDEEISRLQFQHYVYQQVWDNSNFSAPVKDLLETDGTRILDVGCGPATWLLEMATEYQKSNFTGIDIKPTYPTETKPSNVNFQQADLLTSLPFEDNTFDYVFCRAMMFAFRKTDWEVAIKEICRVCKVGGYVEFMEKDIVIENEREFTRKLRSKLTVELMKKNVEPIISQKIEDYIRNTNKFSIVKHDQRSVMIGGADKLGKEYKDLFTWGARNLKDAMKKSGYNVDWGSIEKSIEEISDSRCCDKIHRIWARKGECNSMVEVH
ncbi:17059_t:CDS:2 [Funneliformis geosporum]|uniref:3218_t:CDS:1 n=1 Tax=Funneliformis geosporum TaxID=1117311 RepID=A0A9W4WQR8_9GLOM|nr:17059_t:CDS:2 [Funneliformis geosporum]CAI2179625.1 3218_t:CDS:2 [Funneliformis geosporum]